jgi:hypothetical protein
LSAALSQVVTGLRAALERRIVGVEEPAEGEMSGQMKDVLRAYAIAAGCWMVWDLSLFATADKPYLWSLWWYGWQREFEFYPFSVIAVLLLVVLGWLRLRQNRREDEGIEATSQAENYDGASAKSRWLGALQLGGAGAMRGLGAYLVCILIGVLLGLIVPDVLEKYG